MEGVGETSWLLFPLLSVSLLSQKTVNGSARHPKLKGKLDPQYFSLPGIHAFRTVL